MLVDSLRKRQLKDNNSEMMIVVWENATLTMNMGIRHRRWTAIADPACAGDSNGKYPLGLHSTAVGKRKHD